MASKDGKFIIDKEQLKPGLIIFRRSDVKHRNWYCRVKIIREDTPGEARNDPKRKELKQKYRDKYKTVGLRTDDINTARRLAWDEDGNVRYALRNDAPLFNRSFRQVANEFLVIQEARARRGEITAKRLAHIRSMIEGPLEEYIGSSQVHLIGDDRWGDYPTWRREHGEGMIERSGSRMVSTEIATKMVAANFARHRKGKIARGIRPKAITPAQFAEAVREKAKKPVPYMSEETIRMEMVIFAAIMRLAIENRYIGATKRFDKLPSFKTVRREEFTVEEYRKLHTVGRSWMKEATTEFSAWSRTMTYNMILVACNTGMRPVELKNLRWRDVWPAKDKQGRDIFVLSVRGKNKSRDLVAPQSVGDYLDRVRSNSRATKPEDRVFTTIDGTPAKTLYSTLVEDLLTKAKLREGADGTMRTTYCFRHTYATFRLQGGISEYMLAEQMGTSVAMIQEHYGHVNTIKHADLVLKGMEGWDPVIADSDEVLADEKTRGARIRQSEKPGRPSKR